MAVLQQRLSSFFKKDLVGNIAFLMKRAGHLLSKMRFVSAQLDAYISNDVWLKKCKTCK